MTLKEIHQKAGPLSSYIGYFVLMFLYYLLDTIIFPTKTGTPGYSLHLLIYWVYLIVIVSFLTAGVFGGIHTQQQTQEVSSIRRFFEGAWKYYGRIMGANLFVYFSIIVFTAIFMQVSPQKQDSLGDQWTIFLNTLRAVITLFWFSAIVVERKFFPGLLHAVKTLLLNPYALVIGIIWGLTYFADSYATMYLIDHPSFVFNILRVVLLTALKILTIVYALAVFKLARGEAVDLTPEVIPPPTDSLPTSPSSGNGLVNASFGFAFVSFLPVLHLLALGLGAAALRRKRRFVLRAAIACCVGGFFTIFYILLIISWIASGSAPSNAPGYQFLAETNPVLAQIVPVLEQGSFQELQQIEQKLPGDPERHWTLDSASALAKMRINDLAGALEDFRIAAEKKPERSEFYYYYGVALLDDFQDEMAAEQFRNALTHQPRLEDAERYLYLINTAYTPSQLTSALLFVIILLMLFTLHEYGHAYAAWKLGDNTAKDLGRLTLNPIPHLDLFGSLILPGLLLFQQADVIFGWAKPTPVNPENFKDPPKDHMRVAFAGPAVNFMVALACFILLISMMLFIRLVWQEALTLNIANPFQPVSLVGPPYARWIVLLVVFLRQLFLTSLVLGCFNLIPIPPLDGAWIFAGLLPQGLRNFLERTRRFAFVIFLLLVITPVFDYVLAVPVGAAIIGLQLFISALGLR